MMDNPQRALKEAEEWLKAAEATFKDAEKEDVLANVACAQAIHAIIRANDALTLNFLKKKSTRHDDAPFLFLELIKHNKIEKQGEHFKHLLMKAMREKSGADYGKSSFSAGYAKNLLEEAREFIAMVKKHVPGK